MKKVELHVPNKSYGGFFGGVQFSKGVGVFTDVEMAYRLAEQFGGEVVEVNAAEKEEVKPTPKKRTRKVAAKEGEE